jgi:NAD(P)-dependent dehydrogenase (short-subunit alcohol dehydrogenase family)
MSRIVDAFAPDLFKARSVLVTGGTSGIGLGAALAFRDLGAAVLATGGADAECERARADAGMAASRFVVSTCARTPR